MSTPERILKDTFGYSTFLPLQREVIENVLARRDTLAIMPTGGGKSLCYQIPALLLEGLTVVVSPLIALMKDQVEQLRANGVPAVFLNSSLSPEAYRENMQAVQDGSVKLLYVAPETLLTARMFSLLSSLKLALLTIDEAHCISEWGHDFRPEYRQLAAVRQHYPKAVCLALTATATPRVRSDIQNSLNFSQANEFVASFNRENLFIEVAPKNDPIAQTTQFLKRFKNQSGIIYCFSRRQVDELSAHLAAKGFSVRPYHAGLEDAERQANQEAFIRDDVQIIVATIAFGMGINKPNVRFVLHYDLPKSIEGYYQEIGRAGRDGLPAHCRLLYSYSDVAKLNFFTQQKEGTEQRVASQHLDAIVRFAEDKINCRRKPLLAYFGETYTPNQCGNCDNCTTAPAELSDITLPAQKFLSCVIRTGEAYGASHVTQVLLGSRAEKVLSKGHEKLSTYGIGTELTQKQWMHLARQLVQQGYLQQGSAYRVLSLTPQGAEALKKRTPILGQLQEADIQPGKAGAGKTALKYNHALFAILRQKRKTLADESGVPPYVIFSDRTLVEMCAYYPQSPESLLNISGVGQIKSDKFGEIFLMVIREYCQKHNLKEKEKDPARARRKNASAGRTTLIGEAFNSGESITGLMESYQLRMGTIMRHLEKYFQAGNALQNRAALQSLLSSSPANQHAIRQAFDELGAEYLKPVFERLDGTTRYDDLRILRLLYQIDQRQGSKQ